MSNNFLVQVIGWVGTIFVLIAYYLLSQKKLSGQSRAYQAMNLFGAVGIGVNVSYQGAWPALGLQIVWGVIALLALVKMKK